VTGGGVCVACGVEAISVGTAVCAATIVDVAKTINANVGTVRLPPLRVALAPSRVAPWWTSRRSRKPDIPLGEQITRTLPF
jgi:hypothetical protein